MKALQDYRARVQASKAAVARAAADLDQRRNLLRNRQAQLEQMRRLGRAGVVNAQRLQNEIKSLQSRIAQDTQTFSALKAAHASSANEIAAEAQPWELIEGLDDALPFLLLPMRIETRFMQVENQTQLWVRIFPDEIAVHTHEPALTADEVERGKHYWQELWRASQETNPDQRTNIEKGAWLALAGTTGGTRAAWIARQTKPVTLEVARVDDLQFPAFNADSLKAESWSQAPRSHVMPDRFVVMGFIDGKEVFRQQGNPIPDPLIVGPDPNGTADEFQQKAGDLLVGDDIAWIYDFPQAVKVGMGIQVPLDPSFVAHGLDRVIVLGVRLAVDEKDSQKLVETLLENHSFAADGLSIVPQGTPTNNTDRQGSGFSSVDPGAEVSFAVETGDPLFEPVQAALDKHDGQWLVEALGIEHALFQRIEHADGSDTLDALLMNGALWNATLGYYLDEMLDLDDSTIAPIQQFFTDYVTGRGLVPAIRVGSNPYGLLVTSDFRNWQWSEKQDGEALAALNQGYSFLHRLDAIWRRLIPQVARIGADGDPFDNLLNTLGLQATSAEFYRRHAVGREYLWNYEAFNPGTFQGQTMMQLLDARARNLLADFGFNPAQLPTIYHLSFMQRHDLIPDPLVDDLPAEEREKLSETKRLRSIYRVPDPAQSENSVETNYLGWLAFSDYQTLKAQRFENLAGEAQPIPHPLLYRLLYASLLQALYEAAMRLYSKLHVVRAGARREVEMTNIPGDRTVTRWEFLDVNVSKVLPVFNQTDQSVAEFLLSEVGLGLPDADNLRRVLDSIKGMINLPTARLERAFVEHIDLCSYRLDAWQTGGFNRRLWQQRYPAGSDGQFDKRVQGIYLGAFGWLENLRPAPEPVAADLSTVPTTLHDPQKDGALFEQPDNAGFIHAPSLNHAVTAAVLRNAYLTHFDPAHPEKMAVNLSSERVRGALALMEGVRNGQELGALLGYDFERGLHDRYNDPSLNQYIPFFRQTFPLVADKITADPTGKQIETKEARNVFDGYALLEVAVIRNPPLPYPYGVAGLPPANTTDPEKHDHVLAIQAEVARMADSLDALADLALAEGVYQVTQGNYDRAGAMLSAMSQGNSPPEPQIVNTPRTGTAIMQRVALHFETGNILRPWPAALTPRATAEQGLNRWLGDMLPRPQKIGFSVSLNGGVPIDQNLVSLALQPLDLVYMVGDDLVGATTELEALIAFENRRVNDSDDITVKIEFMTPLSTPQSVTLFELLPLLRTLRQIITSSRPLSASDYLLGSNATTDPAQDPNPQGVDLVELQTRVQAALTTFAGVVNALGAAIPASGADGQPNIALANPALLRARLRAIMVYGMPDAIPVSAAGTSPEIKAKLTSQAATIFTVAARNLAAAEALAAAGNDLALPISDRLARYRSAAQAIFGSAFNLLPHFNLKNAPELQAATTFRDAPAVLGLLRHHQTNPLVIDEWLSGVGYVRPSVRTLETAYILGDSLGTPRTAQKPLQLPFRQTDFWVAVEYPETFSPEGEFLSIFQIMPAAQFLPHVAQTGLMIDEWSEIIPNTAETTGLSFHFNQPNTEPPQALLLAVTPEITGKWTWDKLTGILNDTFERAQMRAVEPDLLGNTPIAQLLPAIVTPVANYRYATITADLIHQTATRFLNAKDT
ncbi:MAG: hypothetical protein KF716_14635 [Anaerolineae bacterium]|nr:hypothetical protein [Anaerolineae bacterium]